MRMSEWNNKFFCSNCLDLLSENEKTYMSKVSCLAQAMYRGVLFQKKQCMGCKPNSLNRKLENMVPPYVPIVSEHEKEFVDWAKSLPGLELSN